MIRFLATGAGVGLIKKAPGTWGSIVGAIFCGILDLYFLFSFDSYWWVSRILVIIFLVGVAFWVIHLDEMRRGIHDDPSIVIDEIVGQICCLVWFPFDLLTYAAGFALFRFLDIIKPGPIRWIDRDLPGAAGTLFDDVLAGLVAAIGCAILKIYVFPNLGH